MSTLARSTDPRRHVWMRCRLGGVALVFLATSAAACEPPLAGADVQRASGERFVVAWRTTAPIRLSEFFGVDFAVCSRDGTRVAQARVDARMPAHRHGMNYRPQIAAQDGGRFSARGLLFHMPGDWELVFDVNAGAAEGHRETVRAAVVLR